MWKRRLAPLFAIAVVCGSAAQAADPAPAAAPAAKKTFSCPATFGPAEGWSMDDHDCGPDVIPPVAVLIRATSDDGKRENLYALCCYEHASLLKLAAPDFAVSEPQWKRVMAPTAVTNRHIYRYVCAERYTGVAFPDCQYEDLSVPAPEPSELMRRGGEVYTAHCASCHKADGKGMPPILPALKGNGLVTGMPDAAIATAIHGRPGTIMLSFSGPEPDDPLSDEDLAAVITHIRNSWGNDDPRKNGEKAGGITTAADVARVRAGPGR